MEAEIGKLKGSTQTVEATEHAGPRQDYTRCYLS